MTDISDIDRDIIKMYTDLRIPQDQSDSIQVQVTLPNNNILTTNFALWDTILDVKHYILPTLQPTIANIQQIKCTMLDENEEFEASDHMILKHFWNYCPLQIFISIKYLDENKTIPHVLNSTTLHNLTHPKYGNVLDTNATMPKHAIGYRNKKTDKLYKNTEVQTLSNTTDFDSENDTKELLAIQTTETQDKATEVVLEFGTQTETINILRSLNIIREITPRKHITSHKPSSDKNLVKYACIIQKSVRKWLSRKKIEKMLNYYYYLKELVCNEEKNLKNIIYTKKQDTIINLQYPTTTKDFEALYSVTHDHYKKIKSHLNDVTTKSTKNNNKLHLKELKCLNEIMKRRIKVKKIAEEKKIFRQINATAKPLTMTRANGNKIFIETPETYQAKQFMELYMNLKRNDQSKKERIELLLKLKETLEQFKQLDLTKPIINLLNRELSMLNTVGLNNDQLQILRKRIVIAFQRILIQPEINPAILKKSKTVNLFKCHNCEQLKSLCKFVSSLDLTKTTICKDCRHLRRITVEQINLLPHEEILKNIKASEAKLCAKSSLAFFLTVEDIHYLVTIIWRAKSAISESKDIIQLTLVRWCNEMEWTPSNTILLTIEEAYHHSKLRDINKVYTSKLIDGIRLKHMIAKRHFKGLIEKTMECDRNIERRKYT